VDFGQGDDDMLMPASEAELADTIASAREPLAIRGGATRGISVEGTPLSVAANSGITLYEPGALTVVARAGTPVAEIEAALAAENQMLAFEPMDHRAVLGTSGEPTIGGVVATNTSGPRRVQAGACRDFLLGVRFVDGHGTVVKNGGRVMKNVTGYDLARLMCGAHGTLGVLTEVSFKTLPRREDTATLVYPNTGFDTAARLFPRAMGSPFEVSGAARLPDGRALVRIEGFADSVAYRTKKLSEALAEFGTPDIDRDPALWTAVRDVTPLAGREGDLWRLSITPTDLPKVADRVGGEILVDWAGGRLWVLTAAGTDLRAKLAGVPGHATLIRGTVRPTFHPEAAPLAKMAAGLRGRFDPKGILNPGLMG
jgi:glycolate oxidase FAD binding subunit